MSIRNVVKVMNFHSLLRVDKSRNLSKKFTAMEEVLTDMIDNIVNNRNIALDYNTLRVKDTQPELNIYIGSDMGFCNNLNSLVKRILTSEEDKSKHIIIGRKIRQQNKENLLLFQTREEYDEDTSSVMNLLEDSIRSLAYSKINIIYNHYFNSTQVQLVNKQIFPIEKKNKIEEENQYKEDFVFEGEIDGLLINLVVLYAKYSMEIAAAASYAAENISRQNVTTESLHKIDEREEAMQIQDRRVVKDKQFAKVLDNYTKLKQY